MICRAQSADRYAGAIRSRRSVIVRALIVVLSAASISAEPPPDPIPIQRIQLPPDRVAAEMEKVRQRVMARLPREQFESLVKEAARAEAEATKSPRLLESHYRAVLEGDGLAGSAEWKLRNSSSDPARLSLDAMQLALRDAQWGDKTPAIIGRLDDKPGASWDLLIAKPGEAVLHLNWSARGLPEPGGVRFDLRLQPCPITVFELEVPSDRVLRADRDSVVASGPLPSDKPNMSLWRLTFPRKPGGATTAQFVVSRAAQTGSLPPVARPLIQTTQRLMPGVVESEFVLDVQVDRGALANFVLICDPGLRVYDLDAPGLEGWETKPAPGGGTLLLANLRDPIRGGRMTLRAESPLPPPEKVWVSPGVRVAGGIPRGEKLTLLIHPDLQIEDWNPGGFRPSSGPAADSMQTIFLQRRVVGSAVRPQARLRRARATFDLEESLDWSIDADRMTLTADWRVTAKRGAMSQISWSIPAGWEVEQVEAIPADPALRWQAGADGLLTIEPGRPLSDARDSAERHWLARLRAAGPNLTASADGLAATIPWPDLQPNDVRQRDGRMNIRVSSNLIATTPEGSPILRTGGAMTYEGSPRGMLQIRPRRGRLQARVDSSTMVRDKSVATTYRLELTPGAGPSTDAYIFTTAPVTGEWVWKTVEGSGEIRRIEPLLLGPARASLAALMPSSIWDAFGRWRAADLVVGQYWRIVFGQPLQKPMTVELTTHAAVSGRIEIPLLMVSGAERLDGRADLHFLPGAGWMTETSGVRELGMLLESAMPDWENHSFRYGASSASLVLRRREASTVTAPRIDRAIVIVSPALEGKTAFCLQFAVSGWMRRELTLRLPAGAVLQTARLDGAAVSIPPAAASSNATFLRLPWIPGPEWRFVEIEYALNDSAWRGLTQIDFSLPELPFAVRPRQVWRLPPGVVPLTLANWRPASSITRSQFLRWFRRDKNRSAELRKLPLEEVARSTPPRQLELLGQWLERWALERRESAGAVVVDLPALEQTGIDPRQRIDSKLEFESTAKRLELIVTANVALLTTPERLAEWHDRIPAEIATAVETAAEQGFDNSGRFLLIGEWSGPRGNRLGIREHVRQAENWIEWDPPDQWNAGSPILIESSAVSVFGAALALLLLAGGLSIRGGRRLYLLAWLLIVASGFIWLPNWLWGLVNWPLVAGAGLTVWSWMQAVLAKRPVQPTPSSAHLRRPSSLVVPPALVLIALFSSPSSAAGPEPTPVYLIPNRSNDRDPFSVLAPPELIDRLKQMAHRNEPSAPAVVTRARYEGEIDGSTVHWDAAFDLYCFRNSADALAVPLEGGQLRRARFDGVELLPRTGPAPGRVLLDLQGQGPHTLRLEFDVPVDGQVVREARCTVPDAAASSISVRFPDSAKFLNAPTARGMQRLVETGNGRRLEADLGRGGQLHLRWNVASATPPPRPQVDEVSMWDLSDSNARLRSVFRYRLGPTAVDQLQIGVPDGLELVAATVRSVDDRAAEPLLTVVKEWDQPTPGRIRFGFEPALSGQVQLNLDFVPKLAIDSEPVLTVPVAIGNFERQSDLGVRLQDLQARVKDAKGWDSISPAVLFRDRWQSLRVDASDQEPDLAFHRLGQLSPDPRISLKLPETSLEGSERIVWRVGPDHADVRIAAIWSEPPASGPLEWRVPANVVVSEVRGTGLRSWSRQGDTVQAWLGSGPYGGRVSLTLVGSMKLTAEKAPAESIRFNLPDISLGGASKSSSFVQVQPREGWRIFEEKATGWSAPPSSDLPGANWSGFSEAPAQATFLLRPAKGRVDCDCLTFAEAAGRSIAFTGIIDIRSLGNDQLSPIQTVAVEVRRAEADKLQLQLPAGSRLRESRPTATGMTWMVDCQPGRRRLVVTGKLSPGQLRDFPMPAVRAHGVGASPPPKTWIVLGSGLRARDWSGLHAEVPSAGLLEGQAYEKIRRAPASWAAESDSWRMQLEISQSGLGLAPAMVSMLDAAAAPGDDGYWLLQARAFLFQDSENAWSLRLPEGAELLLFDLDGFEQPSLSTSGQPALNRSVAAGLHSVRLVWRTSTRTTHAPPLLLPRLEIGGVSTPWPSVIWTAAAGPGFRLVPGSESMGLAKTALSRSAAWLEFHQHVADRSSLPALLSLASAAQADLRRAEVNLAAADSASEVAPDGKTLTEWLKQLSEKTPLPSSNWPFGEPYSDLFHRGSPVHWRSAAGESPSINLEPATPTSTDKWAVSGLLALLVGSAMLIMRRAK